MSRMPPLDLLTPAPVETGPTVAPEVCRQQAESLITCLNDFGIQGEVQRVVPGPVVTMERAVGLAAISRAKSRILSCESRAAGRKNVSLVSGIPYLADHSRTAMVHGAAVAVDHLTRYRA